MKNKNDSSIMFGNVNLLTTTTTNSIKSHKQVMKRIACTQTLSLSQDRKIIFGRPSTPKKYEKNEAAPSSNNTYTLLFKGEKKRR